MSSHPTDQVLQSFAVGQLESARAEPLRAHLDSCAACTAKVTELSAERAGFRKTASGARSETPPPGGSSIELETRAQAEGRADSPPAPDDLPPGLANHPDYKIVRELGRGGMGVVYLAHNTLMGRDEVLKVMGRNIIEKPGVLERFLREIRAVARLRHANIVTAYSAFRLGDSIVFAMEYVDGYDLSKLIKSKGPLPVAHACNFVYQAALGLQHANEEGMVHRDIKPGNLMLARKADRPVIKVLDFGLAKATREQALDTELTREGQMLGTPDYIAPEQTLDAQKADIRADIYSLGCTLYYLLAGNPPFKGTSLFEVLQSHHSVQAKSLSAVRPDVPAELAAVVAKMMAKAPEQRYQTPAEVAKALVPFFKAGKAAAPELKNERPPAPATTVIEDPGVFGVIQPAEKPHVAAVSPAAVAVKPPLEEAVAVEAASRLPWMLPALAGGVLLFGLASAWALGIFGRKDNARPEPAAAKRPSDSGTLARAVPPAPPSPPPLAPKPAITTSSADVRGREPSKSTGSPLEELAADSATINPRDIVPRRAPGSNRGAGRTGENPPPAPPEPVLPPEAPSAKPSLIPPLLAERGTPVQLMQHAINNLEDMRFGKNRQKDAIRDKAIKALEDSMKIAMGGRAPVPRLRAIEKGLLELEANTMNAEGKRRFDRVNELINLAITKLTGGRPNVTSRPVPQVAEGPGAAKPGAGPPPQNLDFRRLALHPGEFRLVAPDGSAPGPFIPELGPANTDGWQVGDPAAIKMTPKELMLWSRPGGNLLLTRKDNFKKCSISAALAVNDGTEAYLVMRARQGADGWHAVTSRIIGQGGKVRAGAVSMDFQKSENAANTVEKPTGKAFRMNFVMNERGAAHITVNGVETSVINCDPPSPDEPTGAAGIFIKTGKILVESLMIRE
jgi:serine/threonine protein kinase